MIFQSKTVKLVCQKRLRAEVDMIESFHCTVESEANFTGNVGSHAEF